MSMYGPVEAARYRGGAPHLEHAELYALLRGLSADAIATAEHVRRPPRVLELGAGEGSSTLPFLEFGAHVTAVDDSSSQLDGLRRRCSPFADRLVVVEAPAEEFVATCSDEFELVAAISFLHHVPDYLGFVENVTPLVAEGGVFFSFQDPLLYARLPAATRAFATAAYAAWRVRQGDVFGGLWRRARRARGNWDETCAQDVIEYHATRGGVDEDALVATLAVQGFAPRMTRYFSTQSRLFQPIGRRLGYETAFGVVAPRTSTSRSTSANTAAALDHVS
jgi:SAM-dependent methyltransferase